MSPAPISLSWTPGERLLASAGAVPSCDFEILPPLPKPYLTLFFSGHLQFFDNTTPPHEKSDRYRALILECRDALRSATPSGDDQEAALIALTDAHNVWHLIEAIYLSDERNSDVHISEFVAAWYKVNYQDFADEIKALSSSGGGLGRYDNDEDLWALLTKLVAVGDLHSVRLLLLARMKHANRLDTNWADATGAAQLGQLPQSDQDAAQLAFSRVEAILARAPAHHLASRSDGSWAEWQRNCALWARAEELQPHPAASRLLGLIGGDQDAIAAACTTWQEMLVACTIYANFTPRNGGVLRGSPNLVSQACAVASTAFDPPGHVAGGALVEAALGHPGNAIVHMGACLPTSWFSAHLCDLLVRAGKLTDALSTSWVSPDVSTGMREFYIKEFARGLERYRGMWRIAVDYYAECPTHGTSLLVDMLSRVPFDGSGDPTAEKVLLVCKKKKLRKTGRDICERLGADDLNQNNFGGAMSWFARGGLIARAQSVAMQSLKNAEIEGPGSRAARALECVVCAVTNVGDEKMREMFDYMRVYCEMQTCLVEISKSNESPDADSIETVAPCFVAAVRRLVGGGGLPRRFWCVVAYEAAKVLELYPTTVAQFSRTALNEVLGALQLVSGPHRSPELIEGFRRRLAFDSTPPGSGNSSEIALSTLEEAETAMDQCRTIFFRNAARKINAE